MSEFIKLFESETIATIEGLTGQAPSLVLKEEESLSIVSNIIPPYENDEFHHGTSAALEFGVCYLNIKHLIILGHSGCGGIKALLNKQSIAKQNDF